MDNIGHVKCYLLYRMCIRAPRLGSLAHILCGDDNSLVPLLLSNCLKRYT